MEVGSENSENFKSSNFCDDVQSNIIHLLNKEGNKQCVDCNSTDVTHINCMLGVFICGSCAKFHQGLGPGLNRVLPIHSKKITNEDVRILTTIGNKGSRDAYEKRLPLCYKRPTHSDPIVFMEEWMKAKYDRKEFTEGMPCPSYLQNTKDGILWKRGKDNRQFKSRRFVLCKQTKTLKYFVRDGPNTTPKAVLNLDTIDAFVAPEKIENPNGMQIIFEDKGSTRSLFVYAETSEELISWYTAIYAAKLQWLRIAFPCTPDDELCKRLWPRIVKEGWLRKCGPEKADRFHNRWVTLFNRKMIYSLDSLDPFPRGEVVIGSFESKLYWIKIPDNLDYSETKGAIFLLGTPGRVYTFMAETEQERKEWVESIGTIIGTPLLPFEQKELAKRRSKGISKRISNLFVS